MSKSVSFVGSGKIVHSLYPALIQAGYQIESVVSPDKKETESLTLNQKTVSSTNLQELYNSDFIFIAVPDSKINFLAKEISNLDKDFSKTVFLHLSGSKTLSELLPLEKKGFKTAGMHPMQTFPSYSQINLTDVYTAIETEDEKVFESVKILTEDLKMNSFLINPEQKTAYHLMGVFVSNFMTANFFNADEITKQFTNIPEAGKLLNTIARQTLENILEKGSVNSLSGPVERGDLSTIKLHLNQLKNNSAVLNHYVSSSLILAKIALEKGSISRVTYEEICGLLNSF